MSIRSLRFNELIKKEVGKILLKEMEFPEGSLATITRVETADDLFSARVFVSVFPESLTQAVLRQLTARIYFLQQMLNCKLLIRPVPRLFFCREKETVQASRIEELLEQVRVPPRVGVEDRSEARVSAAGGRRAPRGAGGEKFPSGNLLVAKRNRLKKGRKRGKT